MNSKQQLVLRKFIKSELKLPNNASLKKIKSILIADGNEIFSDEQFYSLASDFMEIRANEKKQREEEIKIKVNERNAKRRQYRAKKTVVVPVVPKVIFSQYMDMSSGGFYTWAKIMEQFKGMTIRMEHGNRSFIYVVPGDFKEFEKFLYQRWFALYDWSTGSDDADITWFINPGMLNVYIGTAIEPVSDLIQEFREGETNCMLTPIKLWAQEKLEDAKGQSTKLRYITIGNKIHELMKTYINGVPQNKIMEICNILNISISVEMPFQSIPYIYAKPETKALTSFKFMNLRHDHVDEVCDLKKTIVVDMEQIQSLIKTCDHTSFN
jgi:hypothetical protein